MLRSLTTVGERLSHALRCAVWRRMQPALQLVDAHGDELPSSSSDAPRTMAELVNDMSILWGVPTHKTTHMTKRTRRHSRTRVLYDDHQLKMCPQCGSHHPLFTICGTCYEKVRVLTASIKRKMMQYNPYMTDGEHKNVQSREHLVTFNNDESKNLSDKQVAHRRTMKTIKMEQDRPDWFPEQNPKWFNQQFSDKSDRKE